MSERESFERCLERINEITGILSSGSADLDGSVALYKEANELLAKARNILAEAEVKISEISGSGE